MSQCWSEGELRAYLDRELPAHDVERVAGHLKECQACGRVCAGLAARAACVAALFEVLPEPLARLPHYRAATVRERLSPTARWVAAAGLAAALALAVIMASLRSHPPLPGRDRQGAVAAYRASPPLPGRDRDSALSRPGAVATYRAAPQPPSRDRQGAVAAHPASPQPPKPRVDYYVALDDEPIEAGVVVRVGFGGGRVPADVIFGPDGRARAIRLVNDISGEQH